jgi:hypothetical protein
MGKYADQLGAFRQVEGGVDREWSRRRDSAFSGPVGKHHILDFSLSRSWNPLFRDLREQKQAPNKNMMPSDGP